MTEVVIYGNLADAQMGLSRLIEAKYGSDPNVADDLVFDSKAVTIRDCHLHATALIAAPATGLVESDDLLCALYAEPIAMAALIERGFGPGEA